MKLEELTDKHLVVIRKFVEAPEFKDIKDAFVCHTPERGSEGRDGDSDSKLFGKFLGTRYVLNTLQTLARKQPSTETKKPKSGGTERDPDLDPS